MSKPIHVLALTALLGAASAFAAPAPPPRTPRAGPAISLANVGKLKQLREFSYDGWRVVWGPKRGQVALLGWEQPIDVVDADTFRFVEKIAAKKRLISFSASKDWERIAHCENCKKVEILDRRSKKTVVIDTKNNQPGSAFSPDGKILATGGYGTTAKLWEAATGKEIRALNAGAEGGLTVVFSPDGKLLAVGNRNDRTHIYEVATGNLCHILPERTTHELKFSPDGKTLAVAYVDGRVGLWDVASGKLLHVRKSGAQEVYSLDWTPKGDVLVTAGSKGKIVLWDPRNLTVAKELEAPEWVIRVCFSPDGDRLLSAGGAGYPAKDRKVTLWGLAP